MTTRLLALLLVLALGGPPSSAPQPVPVATRSPAAAPVFLPALLPIVAGLAGFPSPSPNGTRPAGDGAAPDRIGSDVVRVVHSDESRPVILRGTASWVRASLGSRYLAMRIPKGTQVLVCGKQSCVVRVVNDYGPSKRKHPERIADLSAHDFRVICGPLSMGVCDVTATVLGQIAPPETDR